MNRCLAALAGMIVLAACGGDSPLNPTPAPSPVPPVGADALVVAAGDIGWCGAPDPEATARLLDNIPGQVLALGDIAYPAGSASDIQNCYVPNWGRHKARTRPVPGNHDYLSAGAAPYFNYFGDAAGALGRGYYSYALETWHVVALDSNLSMAQGSPQLAWLVDDLRSNPSVCTLVYWHHPLFSSGPSGGHPFSREVWRALYAAGAEVVLNGDTHLYERFAPQDADGHYDPTSGVREFVVGTGGAPLYDIVNVPANSEVRGRAHGVLRLTLRPGKYDWEFVPVAGQSFRDSGSAACH
jgi:hypothetical protein